MAASAQSNTNARRLPTSLRASFTIMAALYIAPRDPQLPGDLVLGVLRAVEQAVAQLQHHALPGGQAAEYGLHLFQRHLADDFVLQVIRRRAEDVHVGDVIPLAVGAHGILQRHVPLPLPAGTQGHEDLIFNAPCGIGAQRGGLSGGGDGVGLEAVHCFDQADHPDGDQIVRAAAGHLVLAGDVADQAQVMRDERLTRIGVAGEHALDEG